MWSGSVANVGISQRSVPRPIDFTTGFSGHWADKEKSRRLQGCKHAQHVITRQMFLLLLITVGWEWGQNPGQIREYWIYLSIILCSSVSIHCIHICVWLYREPTVRQNLTNLANRAAASPLFDTHMRSSQSHACHIDTTCCLLCTFAQVPVQIEIWFAAATTCKA